MSREHRVTHPILGPASWREIQIAAGRQEKATGSRVCSWCHTVLTGRKRSRCGSLECEDAIWRSYSWNHCAQVARRDSGGHCVLCGKWGSEIDHIVPVSLGGTGDKENLRALCCSCHRVETTRLARLKSDYVARSNITDPIEAKPVRRPVHVHVPDTHSLKLF